jgi:hypothetical protein
MSWLFITAGVGDKNFELAADRLASQVSKFNFFDRIKIFNNEDVYKYCPQILDWYSEEQLFKSRGFGGYAWKSRFGKLAMEGEFGNFDGVMYLDAGCEVFHSYFSERKLFSYINKAEKTGVCLFKSGTPELAYTKKLVLDRFASYNLKIDEYQFQTGSWLVSGELGLNLLKLWDQIIWENPDYTNNSISPSGENKNFIDSRPEQGVFSMSVRKLGLDSSDKMPPGDLSTFRSKIKLFLFPFAWARNRTGETLVPKYMVVLGKFSLILRSIIK